LELIAEKIKQEYQGSMKWAFFVFPEYNTKKQFNGIMFDLGSELKYYLPQTPENIEINQTSSVNFEKNNVKPEINSVMHALHSRNEVINANIAKWIWYFSVLKAKVFGKFLKYIQDNGIIDQNPDSILTEDQKQVITELKKILDKQETKKKLRELKVKQSVSSNEIVQILGGPAVLKTLIENLKTPKIVY
jgi:hypothetical protein